MSKYKFILAVLLLAGLASCKKDFMDRFPQTSIPPDLFFNTEEDLSLYINGLLTMPGRGQYLGDQDTDDKATTGAVEVKSLISGSPSSQTITSGWSWSRLRNINYFLQNYSKAQVAQEVKDHYAGLARFYRAEFYMEKVKRYSDVPWYSTTINPNDQEQLYKPRDKRALVIDSLMADLAFASEHVRADVPAGTPGKWVVKQVFARHALYEGTFRRYHPELALAGTAAAYFTIAAQQANDVIASAQFAVHNTGNPAADYASLFNSASLASNREVLLANIYDQDLGRNGNNNSNIIDYEMSPSRDLVQEYLMKDGSR
ncbi:MAG: RagB/SusD family nutrient uptake outer membrane protein, partial [Sphingobacteriales bacterium]